MSDLDVMPFGKHRGKYMQEVPESYLCYLYTEASDSQNPGMIAVRRYYEKKYLRGDTKEDDEVPF